LLGCSGVRSIYDRSKPPRRHSITKPRPLRNGGLPRRQAPSPAGRRCLAPARKPVAADGAAIAAAADQADRLRRGRPSLNFATPCPRLSNEHPSPAPRLRPGHEARGARRKAGLRRRTGFSSRQGIARKGDSDVRNGDHRSATRQGMAAGAHVAVRRLGPASS
jgi:hypothetical protein